MTCHHLQRVSSYTLRADTLSFGDAIETHIKRAIKTLSIAIQKALTEPRMKKNAVDNTSGDRLEQLVHIGEIFGLFQSDELAANVMKTRKVICHHSLLAHV